jgi:hypothetical protein
MSYFGVFKEHLRATLPACEQTANPAAGSSAMDDPAEEYNAAVFLSSWPSAAGAAAPGDVQSLYTPG